VPECARATLVAGTPIPLDRVPPVPIVTGDLAAAATPAGDHVLVTWDRWVLAFDVGAQGPTVVTSTVAAWGTPTSPNELEAAADFDGKAFWALGDWPEHPTLVRFDLSGRVLGAPISIPLNSRSWPRGLPSARVLAFDGGMAFTWVDDERLLAAHATLVRADGSLARDVVLASGVADPFTGEGPTASLAALDGDVFALSTAGPGGGPARVTKLGWSDGQTSTSVVPGSSAPSRAWPLLASGHRLLFANDQGSATVLYAGAPGGAFTPVWTLPQTPVTQAVDACGRFVALTVEEDPSQGAQLVAHALQDATPPVVLGDIKVVASKPFVAPAIVGTTTGFAVVWQDGTHSLVYAGLTWR